MTAKSPTIFVAGIDPAAHTGLVVLEIPRAVAPGYELLKRARWAGSARLNPLTRKALTRTEEERLAFDRLIDRLRRWHVEEVAIEEPSDALRSWNGQKQRGQQTGTAFHMGRSYERAAIAAQLAGAKVCPYTVTQWMPKASTGHLKHTQKRDLTLAQLDAFSREVRAPGLIPSMHLSKARQALPQLSADELMALGVLRYHLLRQSPHESP